LQTCRVVAPAETVKIGKAFSAHPLHVQRLNELMKSPGCLHGDVCRLTNLKPLCPLMEGFRLKPQDGERKPGHHSGQL
jgi:hypothetical protein